MMPPRSPDRSMEEREPAWKELDHLLAHRGWRRGTAAEISRGATLYRQVCRDLSRAGQLGLPPDVVAYLDSLVSRAHSAFYGSVGVLWRRWPELLFARFPREVRRNWAGQALSASLFLVPLVVTMIRSAGSHAFAAQMLPIDMLEGMAKAYAGDLSAGRSTDANAAMAGFYVYNNVGIAFRCFASGILFGLGSAFFLVYNGAVTGAVVGYVTGSGAGTNILTFVCGHAPLELTAIVIAGGAGLRMGWTLLDTAGVGRLEALWRERAAILAQVLGAAVMLLVAAAVEGFWSPSSAPAEVKWAVGGAICLSVAAFLGLAGRSSGSVP
jgi:uncharacterized membrane protein SpoIIM required for sporulation